MKTKPKLKLIKGGEATTKQRRPLHPIEQILKQEGKSVAWLAQECKVSEQYLRMIFRHERPLNTNPRNTLIVNMKRALNATLDDLILGR